MNPPHFKDGLVRQPQQYINDDIDMLETIIHHYFKSLSTQKIDHLLENFYQESITYVQEPFVMLRFKKEYDVLKKEDNNKVITNLKLIMKRHFLNETLEASKNNKHNTFHYPLIYDRVYQYLEKDFNQFIKYKMIYVDQWQQSLTRLTPATFVIRDQIDQKRYQESCVKHHLLCLSKTQFQEISGKKNQPLINMYDQYIKRQLKHQRDIHLYQYQFDKIIHIQTEEVIHVLTYDMLLTSQHKLKKHDHVILPVPEDLVELDIWSYKFLKEHTYILWLKNDALLTHYQSIPKNLEVIIDINLICQEVLNINPLELISFHTFQHQVVPILRDIHQTFRIKKIKHYVYGYALSKRDILYRCLTLGFRHLIIHMPHLYTAIEGSLQYMNIQNKPHHQKN